MGVGEPRRHQPAGQVDDLNAGSSIELVEITETRPDRRDLSAVDQQVVAGQVAMAVEDGAAREERAHQRPSRSGPAGSCAIPCFLRRHPGQRLEADPVGEVRRDLGVVVRRRHLDHVDTRHRQLAADPAYGVEQLPRRETARLRRARARRVARVADVDVDGEEHRVAVVQGDLERLVEAGLEPALADLGHLVGPHVLLGHPLHRLGAGPVAAQPHLEEPVAAQGARLDQPAHRLAVAVERAELDVAGVGVGVEVDHRDAPEAEVSGDAGRVGQGDRVVTAEHERYGAGGCDGVHRVLERVQRPLDVAGRHLDVAHVDDAQVLERVDTQREVGPGAVLRAGSRSAGWRSARSGCRDGATYLRRTARRRPPRRPPPVPRHRRRRPPARPGR